MQELTSIVFSPPPTTRLTRQFVCSADLYLTISVLKANHGGRLTEAGCLITYRRWNANKSMPEVSPKVRHYLECVVVDFLQLHTILFKSSSIPVPSRWSSSCPDPLNLHLELPNRTPYYFIRNKNDSRTHVFSVLTVF